MSRWINNKKLEPKLEKTLQALMYAASFEDSVAKSRELIREEDAVHMVQELLSVQGWREKRLAAVVVIAFELEDLIDVLLEDYDECPFSFEHEARAYAEMIYRVKGARGQADFERLIKAFQEHNGRLFIMESFAEKMGVRLTPLLTYCIHCGTKIAPYSYSSGEFRDLDALGEWGPHGEKPHTLLPQYRQQPGIETYSCSCREEPIIAPDTVNTGTVCPGCGHFQSLPGSWCGLCGWGMRANQLNINFESPEHGWMRINISSTTNSMSLNVADAPCNSLHGLAKSLLNLAEGSSEEKVEWSLEPEYAEWRFVKTNNEIHFTVNVPGQKIPGFEFSREGPILFEFKCEESKLIKIIYKGLRDLESKSVWHEQNYLATRWSWEFPSKLLQDVSSKLKKE